MKNSKNSAQREMPPAFMAASPAIFIYSAVPERFHHVKQFVYSDLCILGEQCLLLVFTKLSLQQLNLLSDFNKSDIK